MPPRAVARGAERAEGYRQLVERFGIERVADMVLVKWMSDPDAGDRWEHLYAVVSSAPEGDEGRIGPRPFKYWVILWYTSMGYRAKEVGEQLGIGEQTVKREIAYARKKLGLTGAPLAQVIAEAIRRGKIP